MAFDIVKREYFGGRQGLSGMTVSFVDPKTGAKDGTSILNFSLGADVLAETGMALGDYVLVGVGTGEDAHKIMFQQTEMSNDAYKLSRSSSENSQSKTALVRVPSKAVGVTSREDLESRNCFVYVKEKGMVVFSLPLKAVTKALEDQAEQAPVVEEAPKAKEAAPKKSIAATPKKAPAKKAGKAAEAAHA